MVVSLAALAWFAGALGVHVTEREVRSRPVWIAPGLAGVLHAPPDPGESPLPVAVVCHGFASNAGSTSALSRTLARAGLVALALDMPGHGRSRPTAHEPRHALELALDWVLERDELDPESVVLVGHGAGAVAALEQGQWDPARVAALVLISVPTDPGPGAYPPPSTQIVWGDRDDPDARAAGRALGARLAGLHGLVGGQVYGDPQRGGVRVDELHGAGRWSVLGDPRVAALTLAWIDGALGRPGSAAPLGDARRGWALLSLVSALILLWSLCAGVGAVAPAIDAPVAASGRRLAALTLGLIAAGLLLGLVAGADPHRGPLASLPLLGARAAVTWMLLFGVATLASLRLLRAPLVPRGGTTGRALAAGALLAVFAYVALGPALRPWIDPYPGPGRLGPLLATALLVLPAHAALELGLRDAAPARAWLGPLARLASLAALLLLVASERAPVDFAPLRALLISAPLLELIGWRCASRGADPVAAVTAQSLLTAWPLAALFPLDP